MAVVKEHEEGAALNSGHHRHRRETEENFEATALRPAIRPFGPYRGTQEKRRKKFQLNIRLGKQFFSVCSFCHDSVSVLVLMAANECTER